MILTKMISNFDKYPAVNVSDDRDACKVGWTDICNALNEHHAGLGAGRVVVVIDCYHGILDDEVEQAFREGLTYKAFFRSTDAFKNEQEIAEMIYPNVTDDRIFGVMTKLQLEDFFDPAQQSALKKKIEAISDGVIVVYGEGAALLASDWDNLVYLDMARWEIQLRMRRNAISNLGVTNSETEFALQYKQAYFVDWRVLDRHKSNLMDRFDFVIDTNKPGEPKMITGAALHTGLSLASRRPFRVVPFFDPGPWGGQWLKEVADLDRSAVNYAWGFDCVPEENSLLLRFGTTVFEVPSINVVLRHPRALLGEKVYATFGAEFPIRFDFLDTMDGGNLSLQVHPTTQYIKEHFGMEYTQDESYYMLDVGEDAVVYLGLKEDVDPAGMIRELKAAQAGEGDFDAEKYVEKWPVKKHDHILIPAGTVHCSGKNGVVLEISATPYIFTFKLWDWGRLGMDGRPRPINIEHGERVIQWDRRREWTRRNLLDRVRKIAEGDGWIEEQTGLHEFQFIETRRHWFTGVVPHDTEGGVNVINLVEGREAVIESPDGVFEPFVLHYAETVIIPAIVGSYTIRPCGEAEGQRCATLKAFVRPEQAVQL